MTKKQAAKILIKCAKAQLQRLAIDANLAERYGATYPQAASALKQTKEINEAIRVINE